MIKIDKLFYTQNGFDILKDINTSFHDGEILGIIGKSGSGKTSLLKILAGLLKDYTGEIFYNDISFQSSSYKDIGKHISCLLSKTPSDLIDDTVFNFLLQSRKSFKKLLSPFSEYDIQITEDYINLFDLNTYRDKKVLSLPDGIFKKILLAFHFLKTADVLLLDNPTSDLDIYSISLLQKAIFKYVINGDRIIIIASNDLNFVSQTADRILIMQDGSIEVQGNPDIIDSRLINKYFNTEVLISKNIYNGKPNIHQFSKEGG